MLTNANIMIHSSYDNLSLISPNITNPITNSNPIFDEVQGRGQVSFLPFECLIHVLMKREILSFVFLCVQV